MNFTFFLCRNQNRSQQRDQQYASHDAKRHYHRNLQPTLADHFSPDKYENDRQPLIQKAQTVDDSRQKEVESPEPENREHVRRVHNKSALGNPEDRGDRIDGQRDVRDFHDEQDEKQRRGKQPARFAHKKMFAVVFVATPKMAAGEAEDFVLFRVDFSPMNEEHAHAGVDEERSQYVHYPGKMFDQFHDQRADHPPFQKAMLQSLIHRKRAKDHQEEK